MQLISEWLESLGPEMVRARKIIFPTAAEFAKSIGVSRQALDGWEKKKYEGCTMTTYLKVVRALESQPIFGTPPGKFVINLPDGKANKKRTDDE